MELIQSAAPPVQRSGPEVRMAWILLLLDRGTSYGYALSRELNARGLSAESSAMYRTLRKLDHDGWIRSKWTKSAAGPPRRSYELTPQGRRVLDDMARLIAGTRDAYDGFLRAYEPGLKQRRISAATSACAP